MLTLRAVEVLEPTRTLWGRSDRKSLIQVQVLSAVFPLEEIGAGHVTGKVSFYRSNWKKIGRILSVFIALKKIDRQAI